MTFEEARAELAMLAQGEYRSMSYDLTDRSDDSVAVDCSVYIHGQDRHSGETWREALDKMKDAICGEPERTPDMTEAPA